MREGMRSDFVPRGQPLFDLGLVHQGLPRLAFLDFPFIAAADQARHQKFNRAKPLPGERLQAMLKHVGEPVIKRQRDSPARNSLRAPAAAP